jgi:hypothetical protein
MAMYAACKPKSVIGQRLAIRAVGAFGSGAIPQRSLMWTPPTSIATWRELNSRWREEIGSFDAIAVHERRYRKRPAFALLLIRSGSAVAFVRVRSDEGQSAVREAEVLRMLAGVPTGTFHAPKLLATGQCDGWGYLATSAFSGRHEPPADPPVNDIVDEIQQALAAIERQADTPDGWAPMHGDFTPWNLREVAGGGLVLGDWESVGWGPASADAVLYRATDSALRGVRAVATHHPEAAVFWIDRLRALEQHARTRPMRQSVIRALEEMLNGPAGDVPPSV